jgi:hypothetical protein
VAQGRVMSLGHGLTFHFDEASGGITAIIRACAPSGASSGVHPGTRHVAWLKIATYGYVYILIQLKVNTILIVCLLADHHG